MALGSFLTGLGKTSKSLIKSTAKAGKKIGKSIADEGLERTDIYTPAYEFAKDLTSKYYKRIKTILSKRQDKTFNPQTPFANDLEFDEDVKAQQIPEEKLDELSNDVKTLTELETASIAKEIGDEQAKAKSERTKLEQEEENLKRKKEAEELKRSEEEKSNLDTAQSEEKDYSDMLTNIVLIIMMLLGPILNGIASAVDWIKGVVSDIKTWFTKILTDLKDWFSKIFTQMGDWFSKIFKGLGKFLGFNVSDVGEFSNTPEYQLSPEEQIKQIDQYSKVDGSFKDLSSEYNKLQASKDLMSPEDYQESMEDLDRKRKKFIDNYIKTLPELLDPKQAAEIFSKLGLEFDKDLTSAGPINRNFIPLAVDLDVAYEKAGLGGAYITAGNDTYHYDKSKNDPSYRTSHTDGYGMDIKPKTLLGSSNETNPLWETAQQITYSVNQNHPEVKFLDEHINKTAYTTGSHYHYTLADWKPKPLPVTDKIVKVDAKPQTNFRRQPSNTPNQNKKDDGKGDDVTPNLNSNSKTEVNNVNIPNITQNINVTNINNSDQSVIKTELQ